MWAMTLEPLAPIHHIEHYYGDAIRQLFVTAAALILVGAPFYAEALRVELPFEILGAVILVAIAALANPYLFQHLRNYSVATKNYLKIFGLVKVIIIGSNIRYCSLIFQAYPSQQGMILISV